MRTVDSRVCTVCGQPATAPDVKYMEPRCLEQLAGNIAYELSRITVMDMPTARALVDATVRVLVSKGPAQPTPQQKHIGYMVSSDGRYMYWPVEDLQEARTYCEDNVEPVKLLADVAELNKHEEGQV